MGLPFYVVIRVPRRSSHLHGKGSTFISQLFYDPEYWYSPRTEPATSRSAVKRSTELILRDLLGYTVMMVA